MREEGDKNAGSHVNLSKQRTNIVCRQQFRIDMGRGNPIQTLIPEAMGGIMYRPSFLRYLPAQSHDARSFIV